MNNNAMLAGMAGLGQPDQQQGADPSLPAYASGPAIGGGAPAAAPGYVDPYGQAAAPTSGFPNAGIGGSGVSGTQAAMGVAGAAAVGVAGYAGYNAYNANQLPGQQAGGIVSNIQNGRDPFAKKKLTYKEQQQRTICLAMTTCCALITIIPGAVVLAISNNRNEDLSEMNPDVDFRGSTCIVTTINDGATRISGSEEYEDCDTYNNYNSYGYSSYSSYYGSSSRTSCTTKFKDTCTDIYTYDFTTTDDMSKTYTSATEVYKQYGTCSSTSQTPAKKSAGSDYPYGCFIATSPATIERDTGTGDAIGYTCPNDDCAILLHNPNTEYDLQMKSGSRMQLAGKILLPIGITLIVGMLAKEFCCNSREARMLGQASGMMTVG